MKIVFWGTPKYAAENLVDIVNAGFDVIASVTQPDRRRGRGKNLSPSPVKQASIDLGIPVFTTESIRKDQHIKNVLQKLKADIYVVVAFGQILPKEILNQTEFGCWNSHASLLPSWRGAAPIQWSLISDDKKTGVCIISMEEGLDSGPVIEQESTDISDTDNLELLSNRLSKISSKLLVKSLKNIKLTKGLNEHQRLKKLNAIDQSKLGGNPSYARQISKDDYLIDWNQKSRIIIRKIQGLYPNAFTFYNGKRIKIIQARFFNIEDQSLSDKKFRIKEYQFYKPGQILMVNNKIGLVIMTNDYPIIIKYAQLEGKKKSDGYTLSMQTNLCVNNIIGTN